MKKEAEDKRQKEEEEQRERERQVRRLMRADRERSV